MTGKLIIPLYLTTACLVVFLFTNGGLYHVIRFYDEGVYVVLAKALASGFEYRNETLPGSPLESKYPPGLPVLLALIWRIFPAFPENLFAMRLLILGSGCLFLCVSFAYLKKTLLLPDLQAAGIITLVAVHPVFVEYSSLVATEVPFALVSMTSLYSYSRFLSSGRGRPLIAALILATLAATIRTLGFTLLGTFVIHLMIVRRYQLSGGVLVYAAVNIFLWRLWTGYGKSAYVAYPKEIAINYLDYFTYLDQARWIEQLKLMLPVNLLALMKHWASLIFPWQEASLAVFVILAVGVYSYLRKQLSQLEVHDIYVCATLAVIIIWPWPVNDRFLLAVGPLLVGSYLLGMKHFMLSVLKDRVSERNISACFRYFLFFVALTGTAYNIYQAPITREKNQQLVAVHREFHQTLDWVKEKTPKSAILVGDSDPAYYLFANRKAYRLSYPDPYFLYYSRTTVPDAATAGRLIEWFRKSSACYLVYEAVNLGPWGKYQTRLFQALNAAAGDSLFRIWVSENQWFHVYQLADCH